MPRTAETASFRVRIIYPPQVFEICSLIASQSVQPHHAPDQRSQGVPRFLSGRKIALSITIDGKRLDMDRRLIGYWHGTSLWCIQLVLALYRETDLFYLV